MLRSMYSGISGMKVNQTKLDVIGNNIANLGTTGFKASTVKFQDMLSQNMGDATAPTNSQGGINAQQVGLGVQLASIDTVMTQGMLQPTGRSLDVALDGGGFFMVSKGPQVFGNNDISISHKPGAHTVSENENSEMLYTRAGTFILDETGNLLTSDGYRVMGYPLTNDDNGVPPTGIAPNEVSSAGLDYRFGPGSQLNGYKVVLGAIGPGTVTDAEIDKGSKTIKISGDFSETSTITIDAIESAANKALSAAGISQRMNVSGKPITIQDTSSDRVEGGSDASAPNSVSLMGVTFKFGEGSGLNGYTFKIGEINSDSTEAVLNKEDKTITISANFMEKGAVTGEELADAINAEISREIPANLQQEVIAIGNPSVIPGLEASVENGANGNEPTEIKVGVDLGIKFKMLDDEYKYSELNGYSINVKKDETGTTTETSIDKSSKTITIKYGGADDDAGDSVKTSINAAFKNIQVDTINLAVLNGSTVKVSGGVDKEAPESIDIGGFTIKFPKGELLNDIEFEIVDIEAGSLAVKPIFTNNDTPPTKKVEKIQISGDFLGGTITADELNSALQGLTYEGFPDPDPETVPEEGLGVKIPGFSEIKVSGRAKIDIDSETEMIDGGAEFKAPDDTDIFGFAVSFDQGESLNGYKIIMGDISASAKTSASVSEGEKTITINGNFTVAGATSAREINNVINRALKDKGIEQGVTVTGEGNSIDGTESEETYGGTPVQSLGEDGSVSFVDGSQEVKAYDEGLKTLKIPDTVRMPGTDVELRVKSFNIDQQGIVNCILEDGSVAAVGQLAMADFKNPEGLNKMGGNLYSASANSGEATIKSGVGTRGEDNSKGYASAIQGMVEMSNVDLAEQFTDMITTTRAFQASGKIINTGDEILQDIINLKR